MLPFVSVAVSPFLCVFEVLAVLLFALTLIRGWVCSVSCYGVTFCRACVYTLWRVSLFGLCPTFGLPRDLGLVFVRNVPDAC